LGSWVPIFGSEKIEINNPDKLSNLSKSGLVQSTYVDNSFERLKKMEGPVLAMTTPIKNDNTIDTKGLEKLTRFYIDHGIKNIIAAGTTGYCYTLTIEEHKKVVETIVNAANGEAFIIAGVSHSGTMVANLLAEICEKAGADALLMTPPYYQQTRFSFQGVYEHYKDVAINHSLPLIIYHTRYNEYGLDLFSKCAEIDNIAGIKDASVDYNFARDLLIELGNRFTIISGGSMRYFMWHWIWGARAGVTSIGNLVPEIENQFYQLLFSGHIEEAKKIIIEKEQPLFEVTKEYGWHASLHAAMKLFGLSAEKLRLPLVEPPKKHYEKMEKAFIKLGLLKI
jgi:4-hydroxy-tetrahydrodipicolinate synthase